MESRKMTTKEASSTLRQKVSQALQAAGHNDLAEKLSAFEGDSLEIALRDLIIDARKASNAYDREDMAAVGYNLRAMIQSLGVAAAELQKEAAYDRSHKFDRVMDALENAHTYSVSWSNRRTFEEPDEGDE